MNIYIVKEEGIFLNNEVIEEKNWKLKSRGWGDQLHKICSYNAMVPPRLANYFIEKYTEKGDYVLDPFSGRGTIPLEARLNNRHSYASDLNPFAYVLSHSKSSFIEKEAVLEKIKVLRYEYEMIFDDFLTVDKNTMLIYYNGKVLKQLSFLREKLGKSWFDNDRVDNFILAVLLGIMHGPQKKDGSTIYLSVHMSNGISMSPNYVKKYTKEHNLVPPKIDVFEQMEKRVNSIYDKLDLAKHRRVFETNVMVQDALSLSFVDQNSLDLIFTSPPYLNIINYTRQNWLKLWLLGYSREELKYSIKLNDRENNNFRYVNDFLIPFMRNSFDFLKKDGKMILVIGDVVKKNDLIFTVSDYIQLIENETNFYLDELYIDDINQKYKSTNSLGIKSGKATNVEKIYVFKKNEI